MKFSALSSIRTLGSDFFAPLAAERPQHPGGAEINIMRRERGE